VADFDKAARYLAKQDPPGFFRWSWGRGRVPLLFHSWLDARQLARPPEGDLTCDLIGCFRLPDATAARHALVVEFMAESRPNTAERLFAYLVRVREEPPPGPDFQALRQVGGVVVNLTGPPQPRAVKCRFPGLPACNWGFGVHQVNLRTHRANSTLNAISSGETTTWVLPLVPLMQGGGRPAILEQWKRVAATVGDEAVRATLAGLTLVFAELAGQADTWRQALMGWNTRKSQVVEEWRDEGRQEGRLEARREDLLEVLQDRFGPLPPAVVERVQAATDLARLKTAHRQALHIRTLDELEL
jgi:hypothetical protein